jgi:regulator of sigma E protease
MLFTIIIFIVILGVLIFVHELGHFLVAKKNGVRVDEFGFGFPPRIFSYKRGETTYSLNAIPLGGFVKILGEDGQEKSDPRSFGAKKIWRRALILVAGVAMNIILAISLLSIGNIIGFPTAAEDSQNISGAKVQILQIAPSSPAEIAGLKTGDTIINVNSVQGDSQSVDKVAQVQNFSDQNKGQEIFLTIARGREVLTLKLVPRANPPAGEGAMGVELARIADVSLPWYRAIYEAFISTASLIWLIVKAIGFLLWQLVSRGQVSGDIAGPVGIFNLTGQAAQMGFVYILQLTVLLSINLAIINILPFPALDGGRLIFLLIEKIKGSPVSQKVERAVHSAGFIFLIILMILVTVRDVVRLF